VEAPKEVVVWREHVGRGEQTDADGGEQEDAVGSGG
jgi:hypothetical protein